MAWSPDVIAGVTIAIVLAVIGVAASFGLGITDAQSDAIVALVVPPQPARVEPGAHLGGRDVGAAA